MDRRRFNLRSRDISEVKTLIIMQCNCDSKSAGCPPVKVSQNALMAHLSSAFQTKVNRKKKRKRRRERGAGRKRSTEILTIRAMDRASSK